MKFQMIFMPKVREKLFPWNHSYFKYALIFLIIFQGVLRTVQGAVLPQMEIMVNAGPSEFKTMYQYGTVFFPLGNALGTDNRE